VLRDLESTADVKSNNKVKGNGQECPFHTSFVSFGVCGSGRDGRFLTGLSVRFGM